MAETKINGNQLLGGGGSGGAGSDQAFTELVQSQTIGKKAIAAALTEKGENSSSVETLVQMANHIDLLKVNDSFSGLNGLMEASSADDEDVSGGDPRPVWVQAKRGLFTVILKDTTLYYVPYGNYSNIQDMISHATFSLDTEVGTSSSYEALYLSNNESYVLRRTEGKFYVHQINQSSFSAGVESTPNDNPEIENSNCAVSNDGGYILYTYYNHYQIKHVSSGDESTIKEFGIAAPGAVSFEGTNGIIIADRDHIGRYTYAYDSGTFTITPVVSGWKSTTMEITGDNHETYVNERIQFLPISSTVVLCISRISREYVSSEADLITYVMDTAENIIAGNAQTFRCMTLHRSSRASFPIHLSLRAGTVSNNIYPITSALLPYDLTYNSSTGVLSSTQTIQGVPVMVLGMCNNSGSWAGSLIQMTGNTILYVTDHDSQLYNKTRRSVMTSAVQTPCFYRVMNGATSYYPANDPYPSGDYTKVTSGVYSTVAVIQLTEDL